MSDPSGPWLRPLRQADAADVLEAFAEDPAMERQGRVRTLADAEGYVARLLDSDDPTVFALVVPPAEAEDGDARVRGVVAVRPVDDDNSVGWFWYWTHRDLRGLGLTARAAATVATWALGPRELHRLELGYRVDNPASGAVAHAAGFVPEGREREKFLVDGVRVDVVTCARLVSDPAPIREPVPFDTRP